MTTRNDRNEDDFELSPTLKASCKRTFGWSDEVVVKVLHGYRQFLARGLSLKALFGRDVDAEAWARITRPRHNEVGVIPKKKQVAAAADVPITIGVRDLAGEITFFKLKKTTQMQKVFDTYAQRKGFEAASYRFLVPSTGQRIEGHDTTETLKLKNEETIDAIMLKQIPKKQSPAKDVTAVPSCTIRFVDETGEETFYKLKETTPMKKAFTTHAQRKGVPVGNLDFKLDGERVEPDDTAKTLDLEDGDMIDVTILK